MYLGKKEVKKLKKQKRLEEILEHESSDIVNDTKEYLDEFEIDIPLTRRERKLIAKQREYELLLEQIGEEKRNNANADSEAGHDKENRYIESNNYDQQNQIEDKDIDIEEVDELLNKNESDNIKLTRKEKRALKKEQRLMKKFDELGIDEDDLNGIGDYEPVSDDAIVDETALDDNVVNESILADMAEESLSDDSEFEIQEEVVEVSDQQEEEFDDELGQLKAALAKRKQEKKIEKQQRMQAMLDSLEQQTPVDEDDFAELEEQEEPEEQKTRQDIFSFGRKNKRVNKKQKMKQQMEGFFAELEEKELSENSGIQNEQNDVDAIEEDTNFEQSFENKDKRNKAVDDSEDIKSKKDIKANKRVNREIADALNDNEDGHNANKEYLLEKVKLEIEKEKLALEKYRIKNEAKLKRQIARDKRREMMRMRKEKVDGASKGNINQELSVNGESNFADAIGGVIKEINKEKPEVKDLVTSSGIVTTPKQDLNVKKKKRHKRGVLVVKRSGSSYGE